LGFQEGTYPIIEEQLAPWGSVMEGAAGERFFVFVTRSIFVALLRGNQRYFGIATKILLTKCPIEVVDTRKYFFARSVCTVSIN